MTVGSLVTIAAAVTLGLVLVGHRLGPQFAVGVGFTSAVLVSAAHLAPPWGVFSDSYFVLRPDVVAWVVVLFEILAAVALTAAGLQAMRQRT
jgi:hypothetical protein